MPQQTFSISDLASDFDVSTRTIRFYEEKGLINPERRGQTRIYSAADRIKLKLIIRGKRLGLSLEDSKDIIEMYQPEHDNSPQLIKLINKIRERQVLLKEQLRDVEAMLAELDDAEERCVQALAEMQNTQSKTG
ncbi:MAG: DNA-binding transcriptional MerR regulator [Zhongshania aliphaticivorans]|jgi:DNA-binding transcriptional MerR regulator|uniref:MerR family transcriptional regulator n=1 Tax=Zhongshania aliphaticivorans TaxID=1470434 RepID=A0A127M6W5_9GAMM|nr:MerR family DNA-binding transcriptional regulator [Zhongshania aliphaticivorans]AMO69003.1 MerR family transcriptional regulator [Zhongshania aliphaticivorans]EIF43735.1 transcriptional regulator [gamma proteobacterium BDW918]|tara:strand:+ start:47523 stop:47924 length:402 start_codon:yes stop_codon:yes gene_type:complete